MKKSLLAVLLLTVLVFSIFVGSIGVVSAAEKFGSTQIEKLFKFDAGQFSSWIGVWEAGKFSDDGGISGIMIKYLFLVLIGLLVFSILGFAQFPENKASRMVIAVIVSFLSTIFINPAAFVAMTAGYSALGIAIGLFFPLFILGLFSVYTAIRVNAIGIILQKMLWLFYSVFLFIKSGAQLFMVYVPDTSTGAVVGSTTKRVFYSIFEWLGGTAATGAAATGDAKVITMVLFISSIAIFFLFFLNNDAVTHWISAQMRSADMDKYQDTASRAKAARAADAESTRS